MEVKNSFAFAAVVCLFFCSVFSQELNPKGRNVCRAPGSSGLVCCSGWGQLGDECLTPLCQGNFTCKENEVCVRPNECRCRHGYFGASCDTKCPTQFWGPDCKGKCNCYPNGQCDDLTGECTCNHNRWGPNCKNACLCQNGKCDQNTGKCTCHHGYWGHQCNNACYCSINSICDTVTGRCLCNPGWTGRNCAIQCNCNNSPCDQFTGRCQCRERLWGPRCERQCQCIHGKCNQADGSCTCTPGYRGKLCREPCPAGFYGQNCRNRCGHCKGQQPCKVTEGRCITCDRGWNGTRCDQLCSKGFFGENCQEVCPTCKDGHHCDPIHGKCSHCNPGWIGDRCEVRCPNGTYGENCENNCSHCFNGICHVVTGECLCDPGFYGTFCNMTCPPGQYGVNCNQTCPCHDKNCDPVSGACHLYPNQRMGVIAAGSLVSFLLIVLLSLLCCCCLCRHKENHNKKAKRILCGRFSRISTKLPRIPLRRQKLPKVVAHHDPENTFNCSFIEPPSVADQPSPSSWSSQESFSSFESEDEGPVYYVPHEESVSESKEKQSLSLPAEKLEEDLNDDDAGEYTSLKDTSVTKPDGSEQPFLKSSDSEASNSSSESTTVRLYACITRPSKHSKEDEGSGKDGDGTPTPEAKRNGKPPPSPGKPKPRPPDPSTKPKLSWIHGNSTGSPQPEQQGGVKALAAPKEKKRSSSDGSSKSDEWEKIKEKCQDHQKKQDGKETDAKGSPSKLKPLRRKKSGDEHSSPSHMEHISGVVQNALKMISGFHSASPEKKSADNPKQTTKEPPKSPKVMHPHMNSEAATLLAAQLKEKTQSINRNEGTGLSKTNGLSPPKGNREKPTPPQKAKRTVLGGLSQQGSTKPLLPTTSSLQKMVMPVTNNFGTPEAKSPEKQDLNGSKRGNLLDVTPKKTPIKKPPRKKGKEGTLDTPESKTPQQKTAIMPPQVVK
ncbi:scavenger receptor class F member 2 isoform X2 [Melanotaenia boesemani]|uniref:scavenger receptor class F member 2 isoform X2 n=1 Tax=Melanotaenia boesemani TaxID=1250792 RepID=UPI001C044E78|nr:scavenger receptor class F member 2 isoform X2 [Melanotaenia boesemani]